MMRVGVYIDGFNLYYGARELCGRGTKGWRWLDIRSLAEDLAGRAHDWADPHIERVVYCTARIDGASNATGHAEQDVYLKALLAGGAADLIEYGHYVSRVKKAPLATSDSKGRPILAKSGWPVMVQDRNATPVPEARFMVSYAYREEKGSDVNVASHLLLDVLQGGIDAAIVISNDSDLRFPIQEVRNRVPVGTVNPSRAWLAGDLKGKATDGVGKHWWRQLTTSDLCAHQLSDPCGRYTKPPPW
jgi:hypothetical protein